MKGSIFTTFCKVVHNNVRKYVHKKHKMIKIILIAVYLIALFLFVKDMCKAPLVKIDEDDVY